MGVGCVWRTEELDLQVNSGECNLPNMYSENPTFILCQSSNASKYYILHTKCYCILYTKEPCPSEM